MKIGIIGCGTITKKAYLPVFKSFKQEVYGISDINERNVKNCAKKFNVERWYTDHRDLLAENLDLVCVCTPNNTHAQIVIEAAKSRANILVEKPMATNLSDAKEMLDVCNDMDVKLCVMHQYRMYPSVQEAKRRIDDGRIGRIVSMHVIGHISPPINWAPSTWFYNKWGLLEDFGPHVFDIINLLNNSRINEVKTFARDYTENMNCLNHIQMLLSFENKSIVDIDLSWITGTFEISLKILGTAGTLYIDLRNDHLFETHGYVTPLEELYSDYKKTIKVIKSVLSKNYFTGSIYYHRYVIGQFMKSILNDTKSPITGKESLEVMRMIEIIKRDIEDNS